MPPLPSAPPMSDYERIKATRKMRWWYEHMADYMIANPTALQNDIAAHFNRAPGTISTIINSHAFQAYLRKRREEYTGALDAQVRGKLLKVADRGLDFLLDGLEKKRDSIPIDTLQRTVDASLKSLGYGAAAAPSVKVDIHNDRNTVVPVAVGLDDLEAARRALRASQEAPRIIDITPSSEETTSNDVDD